MVSIGNKLNDNNSIFRKVEAQFTAPAVPAAVTPAQTSTFGFGVADSFERTNTSSKFPAAQSLNLSSGDGSWAWNLPARTDQGAAIRTSEKGWFPKRDPGGSVSPFVTKSPGPGEDPTMTLAVEAYGKKDAPISGEVKVYDVTVIKGLGVSWPASSAQLAELEKSHPEILVAKTPFNGEGSVKFTPGAERAGHDLAVANQGTGGPFMANLIRTDDLNHTSAVNAPSNRSAPEQTKPKAPFSFSFENFMAMFRQYFAERT